MKKLLLLAALCLSLTAGLCFAQKKSAAKAATAKSDIDVDLTRYSATMVYAEVFNMMMEPEKYEGKKIRIQGNFDMFQYDEGGTIHQSYACIIQDATACCAQGMEFVLAGDKHYPEDYPQIGAECTVTGRYHVEDVDGVSYIRLVDSELL